MNWKTKTKRNLSVAAFLAASFAAILLLNIVVGAAANKIQLRWDLTKEKVYALKDETKAVLSNLKEDVTLYYFVSDGREKEEIVHVLNMYRTASDWLHIVRTDPNTNPIAARRFTDKGVEIQQNTIVLERGTRYRAVSPSDMYLNHDKQSGGSLENAFLNLEQHITRAIAYVSADRIKTVCFTVGHSEPDYTPIMEAMQNENIDTYQIDLKTQDIPDEMDAIYIMAPGDDFTENEILRLEAFLSKGKGVHITFDSQRKSLPKLEEYLQAFWGVKMYGDLICERDANRTVNYSFTFIPDAFEHAITEKIISGNNSIVVMHARSMEIASIPEVTVEPLLCTTDKAVSVHGTDASVEGFIREGALPVAAALRRQEMDKPETRLVISGSYKMYDSLFLEEASVANHAFLVGTANYVVKNEDTLSISPKSLLVYKLMISDGLTRFYIVAVCILPALVFFVMGIVVWRRRRHL